MRKIYLDYLPKKKHNKTEVIDWKSLDGNIVNFEYDGVKGEITLTYSYTNKRYTHYIKCEYENREKIYSVQIIKECKINSLIKVNKSPLNKPTEENWLYNRKDLHKFVDDPEDLKNYHVSSGKMYNWKCPSCSRRFTKRILDVTQHGMSCDLCSSSFSKNERLVSIILTKIGEKYIPQKKFDGCKINRSLPFDFYLPNKNMVIETHGLQHYKEIEYYGNNKHTLKSDRIKKDFCLLKNIKYCEINCSSGKNIDTIRQLKEYINIGLSKDELQECMNESMHNTDGIDILLIQSLYYNYHSTREIAKIMNINAGRVQSILENININVKERKFSFERSIVNILNGEIYGNINDLKTREGVIVDESAIRRSLDNGRFVYNHEGKKLYLTRRKFLKLDHDKSKLKKLRDEVIKELPKKEDRFKKYIGKDIDEILNNSTNQKEDVMLLDSLPQNYYIENNKVHKRA